MKTLDEILQNPEAVKFLQGNGISVAEVRFYYTLYQDSKKQLEVATVAETDSQKQYISAAGIPTAYLIPATFMNSQKRAFEGLNEFLQNQTQDEFLLKELKYRHVGELNKAIMPVQKDAVALFIKNFRG